MSDTIGSSRVRLQSYHRYFHSFNSERGKQEAGSYKDQCKSHEVTRESMKSPRQVLTLAGSVMLLIDVRANGLVVYPSDGT